MLQFFRNKLITNIAAVVIFAIGIQALYFVFAPQTMAVYHHSLLLNNWLAALHTSAQGIYFSMGITFVVSLSIAFFYTFLINENEVLYRQTVFPALFYFYLSHVFMVQNLLTPQFLASIFLVLVVYKFLSLDPRNIKTTPFLDMGFFIGIAFCISPDSILYLPGLILALVVAGYLKFKNLLLLLTGLFIPLYFLGVTYFLLDDTNTFFTFFTTPFLSFSPDRFKVLDNFDLIIFGFVCFILLLGLLALQSNFTKNTIRSRRSQQLLLSFLVCGLCAMAFSQAPLQQAFTLLSLPLTPFISYYFLKTKRRVWREFVFALFFFIIIIVTVAR